MDACILVSFWYSIVVTVNDYEKIDAWVLMLFFYNGIGNLDGN